MTDELDKEALLELIEIHGELGEIGHNNVEESFEHLHLRFADILHTDHAFILVHLVERPEPSERPQPFTSWVHTAMIESIGTDAEQRTRIGNDWAASTPNVLDDPMVQRAARGIGVHRTHTPWAGIDDDMWRASSVPELIDETGMGSRVMSTIPVDGCVEVTFGFDRPAGEDAFAESDRQLLHLAFAHLDPMLRSFCQRKGFLPDQRALTPRELDVLEHLLGPYSEKEIADILGLSRSWCHEVVMSIYRKFNVRSRPGLMAKWL